MKTAVMAVLAVVVLSGCAGSMEERRAEGAKAEFVSSKTVDSVSQCVLFNWQEYKWYGQPISVQMLPNKLGGSTVAAGQNDFFVDVATVNNETKVSYYGSGAIGRELQPLVRSCI